MSVTRRLALSLFGAAPLAGPAAANAIGDAVNQGFSVGAPTPNYPHPDRLGSEVLNIPKAVAPHMSWENAVEHFKAHNLDDLRSHLCSLDYGTPPSIDPDIAIKKSWSPMFKVTVQRQRNIDRIIARLMDRENDHELPYQITRFFTDTIHSLMWGPNEKNRTKL